MIFKGLHHCKGLLQNHMELNQRFRYQFSAVFFFKYLLLSYETDVGPYNIFTNPGIKRTKVYHALNPLKISTSANEQQELRPYLFLAFYF